MIMYYMNCGRAESAFINLLNNINFNDYIVDLYLVKAKDEFLERINRQVNVIDLSNIFHPLQTKLIVSQNIHEVWLFALRNGDHIKAIKSAILYAFYKFLKSEFRHINLLRHQTRLLISNMI